MDSSIFVFFGLVLPSCVYCHFILCHKMVPFPLHNPASNENLCTNNENLQTISKKSLVTSIQEPQSAWHDADFSVLYTTTQIVKYLMFGQLSCQCPAFTTMKIYRDLCSERNISYVLRLTQREGCRGSIVQCDTNCKCRTLCHLH